MKTEPSGMLRREPLLRTDVSEEFSSSFIGVTRIGELGTLAVTSNRRVLGRNTKSATWYFFAACVGCYLQLAFLVRRFLSPWCRRCYVPPKRRFLQESHGVTSQKTPFFIVPAVKTSNLTSFQEKFVKVLHVSPRISESFHSKWRATGCCRITWHNQWLVLCASCRRWI
jgi:hypothetical protein